MDLIHCDNLYVLDEQGRPVKEPNILSWVRWFEGANDLRVVARTQIGGSAVSTVFLAVDHRFRFRRTTNFVGNNGLWRQAGPGAKSLRRVA